MRETAPPLPPRRRSGRQARAVPPVSVTAGDWQSIKQLAVFGAANGWPFDFALMVVVYVLLGLVRVLLWPVRAIFRGVRPRGE